MGFFARLFGKNQDRQTVRSHEDLAAEASIRERAALTAAERAEAKLNDAVQAYKQAEKEGASKVSLINLRSKVERANATYAASIQALRSRGTNITIIEQVSNNKLMEEASGISISIEELDSSVRRVAEAREREEAFKTQAQANLSMVQDYMEDSPSDVDALLHPDTEDIMVRESKHNQAEVSKQVDNE